jgi:tripartite-type tricarboxylate transporter receptor subunit TctC
MKLARRRFLQLASGAIASPAVSHVAHAQAWPTRPITLVVPYPPGGPTDTIARLLADRMRASLGQPVVIENMSGGGGTIAVTRVARSPGDGYTLSIGHWGSHVVNGAVYTLPNRIIRKPSPASRSLSAFARHPLPFEERGKKEIKTAEYPETPRGPHARACGPVRHSGAASGTPCRD